MDKKTGKHNHNNSNDNNWNHDRDQDLIKNGTGTGNMHNEADISGKRIFWVTSLNALITITEIIGGLLSGSLALLSDAMHNLSDTAAVATSYFAHRIARRPVDDRRSYGYRRAEILAAFVNSAVLLSMLAFLIVEAVKRLWAPQRIDGALMIIVAVVGLAANLLSVLLLEKHSHDSLNIRSSYLHLISDTVSSVGVLAGGIIINIWGLFWLDPVITILISLYILKKTWDILKKATGILMQSSAPIDNNAAVRDIKAVKAVKNVHHVHTWMSDEKTAYFEAHIEMEDMPLSEAEKVYGEIECLLKERYGVSHVTLQAETGECCGNHDCNA